MHSRMQHIPFSVQIKSQIKSQIQSQSQIESQMESPNYQAFYPRIRLVQLPYDTPL